MKRKKIVSIAITTFLSTVFSVGLSSHGFSQTSFYEGKTITIISGREPGGTGDQRVRSMIPFLRKYIPGNPTIVLQSMDGAGGRKAANHLYQVASPDGLTIGNIGAGFISSAFLGATGVNYDIDNFIYLGSANSNTSYVFVTNKDRGFDNLAKLRAASGVRIGGQSVGHEIYVYGRLFAWLLHLKDPKFVTGYSGPELDVAVERGEVDARASVADNVPRRSLDWINKKLMDFHTVLEIPKGHRSAHPVYKNLPALHTFIKSDIESKVFTLLTNLRLVGSPNILPPGTPSPQAETLREAFRKTFADPDFSKTFSKLTGEEAYPLTPEEQEKALKELPRDKRAIEAFRQISGGGPLPSR
jgi:tripartite-type tricarboxylate transporter receptor subunit TctC